MGIVQKPRPAAVFEESDPRAEQALRAVPKAARFRRVGSCILGYDHDPQSYCRGWTQDRQRVAEIERLIRRRHGGPVDTDDGLIYLELIYPHLPAGSARAWATAMAPLLTDSEFLSVAASEPKRFNATEAGKALALTRQERNELKITTIRAVGQTDESMKKERRERDAAAARAKRAALPKKEKLKDTRPWEAQGISYRTWRRRRQNDGQKNVGSKYEDHIAADEKMATPNSARPAGRAAKMIRLSPETTAKLHEIGRIATNASKRASGAAVALVRVLQPNTNEQTPYSARLRPIGAAVQSQPSIPVKTKIDKGNRRAVA
ncbi:hypothetical protein [Shinella pollutisoli]|uniref:Uncharacterized protein n=1 Tax=Shinella pollutisoli TaxID=2250594 RepID=A0ABV7DHT0_9HYPH|nr:hypothetical protein [Shinella pollutisoli]